MLGTIIASSTINRMIAPEIMESLLLLSRIIASLKKPTGFVLNFSSFMSSWCRDSKADAGKFLISSGRLFLS